MKKRIIAICACALAFCAPAADSKIATRDWVAKKLLEKGIRLSTATFVTNANGTITYTSPFHSDHFPEVESISLIFSPVVRENEEPLRSRGLRATSAGAPRFRLDFHGGSVVLNNKEYSFTSTYTFSFQGDLPSVPDSTHAHDVDPSNNCKCRDLQNRYGADENGFIVLTYGTANIPEEYYPPDNWAESWAYVSAWADVSNWSWTFTDRRGNVVKYLPITIDGSDFKLALDDLQNVDAFYNAANDAVKYIINYFRECEAAYAQSHTCIDDSEFHAYVTKTCGQYSWTVCGNNPAHRQGTEQHDYPGSTWNESWHSCKCGHGPTQAHGTLVESGSKSYTYNDDGKETGWTQTMVCPKGCGYFETKTHVHHFTNCGTCDAGDDCDTVCTGCNGEHVWGEATVTGIAENDLCAKCECTMCEGCNANPPATNMTLHAGWMPCGVDPEIDNDDGTAKGAHCQCQCLTFGHNAAIHGINESEHDYQKPAGMADYEQIRDHTAPTRANTYHYQILGQCTRCKQYKKQLDVHDWPTDPTRYDYVSDSVCAWIYECKKEGCAQKKRDETHGHELGSVIVYENVSASICRQKKQCEHCKAYISDDTHGHTRDSGNGCKCANGCGYQFEHSYSQDACGNSVCSNCGTYQYSHESHSGYMSGGSYSASGHQCLCGVKPDVPHVMGTPVEVSRVGWIVTYRDTCTACPFYREWTEDVNPCKNGHVLNTSSETCECYCGYYSPSNHTAQVEELHNFADTENSDGVQKCMCKCGKFHVQREWTTYRKNVEDAVGSEGACLGVCSYCKEKAGTGIGIVDAADSVHTPRTKGCCGCKCGKLTADGTDIAKFHIQKPGTCRCYGSDGNGGGWHFKCPKNGCTKICAYSSTSGLYNGEDHLVASSDKEKATPAKATPSSHTKTSSSRCGCECGTYTSSNYSSWTQHANLHNSYPYHCGCYCGHASHGQISPYHKKASDSNCKCQCGAEVVSHVQLSGDCKCQCRERHYRQDRQDGKCPGVCHGPCGDYMNPSYKDKHTHNENGCGCECGAFNGHQYTSEAYHGGTGSPSCRCSCGDKHLRFVASACPNVCETCGKDVSGARSDEDIHTFPSGQCTCNCERYKKHKYAHDKCVCYCGDVNRSHIWRQKSKTQTDSYSCQQCGKTIREYHIVWECSRCGEEFDGTDTEEGHDPDCGLDEHDDDYPGGYCEKHHEYYTDECPYCKEEENGGNGGGGGNGGNTGGGGGLGDI